MTIDQQLAYYWAARMSILKEGQISDMPQEHGEEDPCVHHWLIDSPKGPTSHGICLHCSAERADFKNTFDEEPVWRGKSIAGSREHSNLQAEYRELEAIFKEGI